MLAEEARPVGMTHHPVDVMADHGADAALRGGVAMELGEEPLLVVARPLEVERRRELVLAGEVVVDASGRDPGLGADVAHLGLGQAGAVEAAQGGIEDLAAADPGGRGARRGGSAHD